MRIRIDFGLNGQRKELNWYQDVTSFPKLLKFDGKKWKWVMYGKDPNGMYDIIMNFSEIPSYDPDSWANMDDFEELYGYRSRTGCECGAIHTSFPQIHMFFCQLWRKL